MFSLTCLFPTFDCKVNIQVNTFIIFVRVRALMHVFMVKRNILSIYYIYLFFFPKIWKSQREHH